MAKKVWISGAPAIAQVITITVGGTAANGQVYTVTMGINNTKTVSYTAVVPSDTNTTIATSLQTLLANSTYGEFAEITWANPSAGVITGTMKTPGVPFSLTSSATGTGTLVSSTTTSNSGPNDVSIAANWSTNALPAAGDDVYITNSSQGLLYNLSALSAVVLNSLTWDTTFTGQAGLPAVNANGYEEYRPLNFQIQTPTENYLAGTGGGSQLIRRDNGATTWTVNVSATGSPLTQGRSALYLKGSGSATLTVTQGYVGTAMDPGDTANWTTIYVGYQTSQKTDANIQIGAGATVATINQDGGKVYCWTSVTTWNQRGGTGWIYETGTIGTLNVQNGTFSYQSSGTVTTMTIGFKGIVDYRQDPRSRTVTNCTAYGPFYDPNVTVAFTNPVFFPAGEPADIDWGINMHLQRS